MPHPSRRGLLTGLAVTSFAGHVRAQTDVLSDIQQARRIRVGIFEDLPPFSFMGPTATMQGYDIDVADMIARDLGVRSELVGITGQNRIPNLAQGRVDYLVSVGWSEERQRVVDFTDAYAPYFITVLGPRALQASGPGDLAGRSVAVVRATVADTRLQAVAPANADIRRFDTYSSVISAFLSGQVQFMVVGSDVAANVRARRPPIEPEEKFQLMTSHSHIAVNKGQERLRVRLNQVIAGLRANGELNRLSERWLLRPLPADL